MRGRGIAAGLLIAASWACGGQDPLAGGDAGPDGGAGGATWYQDVAPIVAGHCSGCHVAGGIAPFALTTYDDARPMAPLMAAKVAAGQMPPWGAVTSPDCAPRFGWQNDPRLSAAEQATLQDWADHDAPAGDPAHPAALPLPPDLALTGVTHTVTPAQGFAPAGDTDQMRCFLLDPAEPSDRWITGLEVVPGHLEVVHHAVLTMVPPAGLAEVEGLPGADGSWDCFGGVTATGATFVGVWVPGSLPYVPPTDVGIPWKGGSKLVMQIHYHPAGKPHDPDATTVNLRMTATRPAKQLVFFAIGNAATAPLLLPGPDDRGGVEFRIPAGVKDHTETMRVPISLPGVTQRFPIVSAFPHMHYVGTALETTITRPNPAPGEPASECLMSSAWNFDWQRTYLYDAPLDALPTIGDGDELTLRCTYDNTLENPFVVRGLGDRNLSQPIDVYLGEQTLDEMCIAAFGVVF